MCNRRVILYFCQQIVIQVLFHSTHHLSTNCIVPVYVSLISTLYLIQNVLHFITFIVHNTIIQLDFTCFNFSLLFILIILDTLCIVVSKIVVTRMMMAQYVGRNM
jgi:hypothetical protein